MRRSSLEKTPKLGLFSLVSLSPADLPQPAQIGVCSVAEAAQTIGPNIFTGLPPTGLMSGVVFE
jgi:hypothetical protein